MSLIVCNPNHEDIVHERRKRKGGLSVPMICNQQNTEIRIVLTSYGQAIPENEGYQKGDIPNPNAAFPPFFDFIHG